MELTDRELLRTDLLVGGKWTQAEGGRRFAVDDPATGETIAEVADASAADAERAIAAAAEALPGWSDLSAGARADRLYRWWELIEAHARDLAALMTAEQGKPLAEARGEVNYGNAFVRWFAEEARRAYGDVIPAPSGDRRILALKQPVGVVAAITPWNFPVAMITRKIAPALAAGCTVVVKPPELTPLCALALGELARRAGFPAGVINLVPTSDAKAIGRVFTDSSTVRKLSFTGSTAVGKQLMAACAGTVKKVSLELGGNAPFIVFDDADLDLAVKGLMASKFRNAGQTCVSPNRVLVQAGIHDRFVAAVEAKMRALNVGPGTGRDVSIGPLISDAALEKVQRLVADALARGASCVLGGEAMPALGPRFFAPTLLTGVDPLMALSCEEVFGPVVPVMRFETEAEAVAIANGTPYGLAAYFYTADQRRTWRMAEALDYGMVGANEAMISNEAAPFGGIKESGIGREGSMYGIGEYLETKYLCLGGLRD